MNNFLYVCKIWLSKCLVSGVRANEVNLNFMCCRSKKTIIPPKSVVVLHKDHTVKWTMCCRKQNLDQETNKYLDPSTKRLLQAGRKQLEGFYLKESPFVPHRVFNQQNGVCLFVSNVWSTENKRFLFPNVQCAVGWLDGVASSSNERTTDSGGRASACESERRQKEQSAPFVLELFKFSFVSDSSVILLSRKFQGFPFALLLSFHSQEPLVKLWHRYRTRLHVLGYPDEKRSSQN